MNHSTRLSYLFMLGLLVLVVALHITTPLITVLFAFFALNRLSFGGKKWVGLVLFTLVFVGVVWGFVHFAKQAREELPKIGEESIQKVTDYAEKQGWNLPFTDYKSLRTLALGKLKEEVSGVATYARKTVVEFVSFLIGVVVALSLFLGHKLDLGHHPEGVADNAYAAVTEAIAQRFRIFYESFSTVMGAQLIISLINTAFTAVFVLWNGYPNFSVIVILTFVSGMLPIIGNLVSNTLIIAIGFTLSPMVALWACLFLVVIHKLEYFLNSRIIGARIRNPMWLTLLALLLGERLMGIPGMILAPVVLHYIKLEASRVPVRDPIRPFPTVT